MKNEESIAEAYTTETHQKIKSATSFLLLHQCALFSPLRIRYQSRLPSLISARLMKFDGEQKKGTITYNGHTLDEFVPQKTSVYISQNDLHVGELTVRETLDFSARCQGVGTRYGKRELN